MKLKRPGHWELLTFLLVGTFGDFCSGLNPVLQGQFAYRYHVLAFMSLTYRI